jgi:phage FluMu protein Com
MGMFDWINFEMECPVCKTKVNGFQSKDGPQSLEKLSPYDVFNFYSFCPKCKTWIEFTKKYIKPEGESEIIPLNVILQSFDMKIRKWEEESTKIKKKHKNEK